MTKPPITDTTLEGHLVHITYFNNQNHFMIGRFREDTSKSTVSILGHFPEPNLGENIRIEGVWQTHPKYGPQLRVSTYEILLPQTVEGVKKYLSSAHIKGIGPKMATKIISRFGEDTLDVIEKTPDKLLTIKGIGRRRVDDITESWKTHHTMRGLLSFLRENGVDLSYGARIFREYGAEAIDILETNPFRIINDIPGIGFFVADAIQKNSGLPVDELERAKACALYILKRASDEGHTFLYYPKLLERCRKKFNVDDDLLWDAVTGLADGDEVRVVSRLESDDDGPAIYPQTLFDAEEGAARKLVALLSVPMEAPLIDAKEIKQEILHKLAITPSAEQLEVVRSILSERVAIITGGPGTGKTTLIRSLTAVFDTLGEKTVLAAPTGRAARRISEVTRRRAATLHKMLQYNPTEMVFEKNRDNPIEADVIIVDEASMVDIVLMYNLMNAVPMLSRLILVGDTSQLPSVGPGNVLSDLIRSEKIKTFTLTTIFRQARRSRIIVNAHHVCRGHLPALEEPATDDGFSEFCFIEENNPDRAAGRIVKLCCETLPQMTGLDATRDIQLITPMHKGVVGTLNLNTLLQKRLNPATGPGKASTGTRYKPGDKVMHLKNNYQKDVFNGDIGIVSSVEKSKTRLEIDYDGRGVTYDFSETDELTLAYAISVHKSQGSEYPAVVLPLMTQHFPLLQRNLLYTAITRGKQLVVIIGSRKAAAIALKNDKPQLRLSRLFQRISEC